MRVAGGEARADDWQAALGRPPDPGYRLDRDQLRLVSLATHASGGGLSAAVCRLAGGHLDGVAVRVRPRRTWDDLIVPPDDARQLRELAARHRGRDVVYRQWGEPDTDGRGQQLRFHGLQQPADHPVVLPVLQARLHQPPQPGRPPRLARALLGNA